MYYVDNDHHINPELYVNIWYYLTICTEPGCVFNSHDT